MPTTSGCETSSSADHLEAERGLFIAEGEKVVRRAVEAGCRPRSFLMAERWLAGLADVLASAPDVPCFVVTEDGRRAWSRASMCTAEPSRRCTGRCCPASGQVLDGARRIVVLEDVVDHANVGAILRSAAALGMDGALLSPRCADPLYRRSVKVAMGAVFSLPWTRISDWYDALPQLCRRRLHVARLDARATMQSTWDRWHELRPRRRPVASVLGTEGPGLSDSLDGGRRPPGADSHDRRHRLAQRRCRDRGRLLRALGAELSARSSLGRRSRGLGGDRPVRRIVVGVPVGVLEEPLAGPGRQPVAEDHPLEVVVLVLQAAARKPVPEKLHRPPGLVHSGHPGKVGAGERSERPGQRQAPSSASTRTGPPLCGTSSTGLQSDPALLHAVVVMAVEHEHLRRPTPTWFAARPTPSAAYIVATMSATSVASSSSKDSTGRHRGCITGSPQRVIGSALATGGEVSHGGTVSHAPQANCHERLDRPYQKPSMDVRTGAGSRLVGCLRGRRSLPTRPDGRPSVTNSGAKCSVRGCATRAAGAFVHEVEYGVEVPRVEGVVDPGVELADHDGASRVGWRTHADESSELCVVKPLPMISTPSSRNGASRRPISKSRRGSSVGIEICRVGMSAAGYISTSGT